MRHAIACGAIAAIAAAMIYGCSSSYGAVDDSADAVADARQEQDPDVAVAPLVDASDASDASTDVAAETTTPGCNLQAPFSTPAVVPGLGMGDVYDPWVDDSELEIYFAQTLPGMTPRIVVATRPTRLVPFGVPVVLGVSAGGQTYAERPSLTRDRLTLAFRSGSGGIAIATRATTSAPFGAGSLIAGLPSNPGSPSITNNALYFSATATLYRASLSGSTATSIVAVPGIQLPATQDDSPAATPDELTLFFQSDRTTPLSSDRDVWLATRTSTAQPFTKVVHVPELSTSRADFIGSVSSDGCVVYGSTSLSSGQYYIWRAERPLH